MNLNKTIRRDICKGLVEQASRKHAASMTRAAKDLNKLWAAAKLRGFAEAAPQITADSYKALIEAGVLRNSSNPTVELGAHKSNGDLCAKSYSLGEKGDEERNYSTLKAMRMGAWGSFMEILSLYSRDRSLILYAGWQTPRAGIPGSASTDVIGFSSTWDAEARVLQDKCNDLRDKFIKILEETLEYWDQVALLLVACKTEKQLADRFPEALKFLPKKPEAKSNIVPVELYEKARKVLEEGIPT